MPQHPTDNQHDRTTVAARIIKPILNPRHLLRLLETTIETATAIKQTIQQETMATIQAKTKETTTQTTPG